MIKMTKIQNLMINKINKQIKAKPMLKIKINHFSIGDLKEGDLRYKNHPENKLKS